MQKSGLGRINLRNTTSFNITGGYGIELKVYEEGADLPGFF